MSTPTIPAPRPSSDLEVRMRRELLLYIVQRNIWCPVNGQVLDVDDCVVFLDEDGDPKAAVSQAGYTELIENHPGKVAILTAAGMTVDPTTVA